MILFPEEREQCGKVQEVKSSAPGGLRQSELVSRSIDISGLPSFIVNDDEGDNDRENKMASAFGYDQNAPQPSQHISYIALDSSIEKQISQQVVNRIGGFGQQYNNYDPRQPYNPNYYFQPDVPFFPPQDQAIINAFQPIFNN